MSTDLELLVNEAFSYWKCTSPLKHCKIKEREVLLVGNGFGLLTWLDRDGISMWYLDFASERPEMIDLASYLAIQRKWQIDESAPLDGSPESELVRGMRSYAKTLCVIGKDILSGDKAWLKTVSRPPSTMNAIEYEVLRAVAASAHSSKNPSTGS